MKIVFSDDNGVFEDFTSWALEDKNIYRKILALIKDIQRDPFNGVGKPEPLKHNLTGYWSRRINEEHRLVYQVPEDESMVIIISCKKHYG